VRAMGRIPVQRTTLYGRVNVRLETREAERESA
jgi:hypothetical protein